MKHQNSKVVFYSFPLLDIEDEHPTLQDYFSGENSFGFNALIHWH
jgi:hypothetical protein